MTPKRIERGRSKQEVINRAMRMCKFHFSMARDSRKPDMNMKMVSLKYCEAIDLPEAMPSNGPKMTGKSAVTDKGSTSVTQHVAMITSIPSVLGIVEPSGPKWRHIRMIPTRTPTKVPIDRPESSTFFQLSGSFFTEASSSILDPFFTIVGTRVGSISQYMLPLWVLPALVMALHITNSAPKLPSTLRERLHSKIDDILTHHMDPPIPTIALGCFLTSTDSFLLSTAVISIAC